MEKPALESPLPGVSPHLLQLRGHSEAQEPCLGGLCPFSWSPVGVRDGMGLSKGLLQEHSLSRVAAG